ncbi:leucine-rich repeat-containing protein 71 [Epinephelus fuscoguttatus]|uniref:leucine-rich repeat-containing protein 71 n=1 Tax=Epinephelus fuscoguttatus TaxID=293821 RepID=UPI0020D1BD48|nr:leucine-rich repeat-containing protein 71 [Epinephelus fuscoguttatus]
MSKRAEKEKKGKANTKEETSKNTGPTPNEKLPVEIFGEYQCSGNVEIDFAGLCALLDIKDIPAVITKQPASPTSETAGEHTGHGQSQTNAAPSWWSKRCLQVELENEDPLSAKHLKIFGWKVDEQIARVLHKMLPSLNKLQHLQFWQAGLSDRMVISLMNTISLCSNLRTVTLQGNPLPEQSYHLLLSEASVLTHLYLNNNRIGDEGARLIGLALSTTRSANKNLLALNLAFNSIGNAGAAHIAQGLRFNRSLRFLSLCNNQIGDAGAAHLAAILGEFALTHEEVVERRKLLLKRTLSADADQRADQLPSVASSSSLGISKGEIKDKKQKAPKKDKDNPESNKKFNSEDGQQGGKEKQLSAQEDKPSTSLNEQGQLVKIVNPLLDEPVQYRDGELFLPGNTTLASLNLAGNRITEKSLPLLLTTIQAQGGTLLHLCLQRNRFPPECECYVKITEVMAPRHPLRKKL